MIIYSVISLENEDDQVVRFELRPARLGVLSRLCEKHHLNEVVVPIPTPFTVQHLGRLPQGGPTDGFMAAEDVDRLQQKLDEMEEDGQGPDLDLDISDLRLGVLYVSKDRLFIEIIVSEERWLNWAISLEELDAWSSPG